MKKFLLLGNMNALTYKEVFPHIMHNEMRYGVSISSGDRAFYVPDDYEFTGTSNGVDSEGRRYVRVKGVRWFTNLDCNKRVESLMLEKEYSAEEYPKFDDYDAINVNKACDIPKDYDGVMGVPITFLDKYDPEQFEIVGMANAGNNPEFDFFKPKIDGECLFKRILIKRK